MEGFNSIIDIFKYNILIQKINENDFRFLVDKSKKKIETSPYIQVFKIKYGYLSNLSILDLLFNLGPESTSYLINHPKILH